MLIMRMSGDCESRGRLANPGLRAKWPLKLWQVHTDGEMYGSSAMCFGDGKDQPKPLTAENETGSENVILFPAETET